MKPDEREYRRMQRILNVLVVLLIPGGLVAAGVDTLLKTGVLFSWYVTLMFGAIVVHHTEERCLSSVGQKASVLVALAVNAR